MLVHTLRRFKSRATLVLLTALSATPVLAQTANFASLTLSQGFSPSDGVVSGFTGGSYSLAAISNSDRQNNRCIGFASPTPDHIMVLERDFPKLTVQVNSGGSDTTLLIKGPGNENTIRCGDDTGSNKDASISDTNWKAGRYSIWVGTFEEGVRRDYSLSVEQE
ncbi:MAG TPA: hypothetical protein DCY88_01560 [Cyanobacteria bacterium UBA11372]|nr:hypothetical protein [Cyanobacteria bacterium UBA11372]